MVADMPLAVTTGTVAESVTMQFVFIKESGAEAVKYRRGPTVPQLVRALTEAEIPVVVAYPLAYAAERDSTWGGYRAQAAVQMRPPTPGGLVRARTRLARSSSCAVEGIPRSCCADHAGLAIPTIGDWRRSLIVEQPRFMI